MTQILDGIIAGLASITPAAGYVTGMSSVAIGAISGFLSFFGCIHFRRFFRIDDALNVAMVHGIPSLIGRSDLYSNHGPIPDAETKPDPSSTNMSLRNIISGVGEQ